jgi:hypothetical protein
MAFKSISWRWNWSPFRIITMWSDPDIPVWICNHQLHEIESQTEWSDNTGFKQNWWLSQKPVLSADEVRIFMEIFRIQKINTFAPVRKFHHCVSSTTFNWYYVLSMPHNSLSCKGTKLTLLSSLMPVSVLHNKQYKSPIIHRMPRQWVG